MSKAQQALLWSALIFPGAGHIHLKYFQRGIAFIVVTLFGLILSMIKFAQLVYSVFEKLLANGATLGFQNIIGELLQAAAADPLLIRAIWLLALCWLSAMIDAYRLGKTLDN